MNIKQNYINHIVFILDESTSMFSRKSELIKVLDSQVNYLAKRSTELNQETRITIYTFSYANNIKCVVYDKDVVRLPSISDEYSPDGNTALIDATILALDDLKMIPQKYGDHSFLIYVLTDGADNNSKNSMSTLNQKIKALDDNYTVAVLVPDQTGVFDSKKCGFPADNIKIWSLDDRGLEKIGSEIKTATDNFMVGRTKGVRGTKNLFTVDQSKIDIGNFVDELSVLKPKEYLLLSISKDAVIKPYIEGYTKKDYTPGSGYYQLTKKETVQSYKQICIQCRKTGKVYYGDVVRSMLSLPNSDVKVNPVSHGAYDIFVQSSSVNRKLLAGTKLLVIK